ncbi:MAG: hypothetical protein BGO49_12705 [Planctomycetales bacterium 71-10]|nr:MAG: hypothetical protein BGO49_12705 [Planctomycetales bacterium 71-10]
MEGERDRYDQSGGKPVDEAEALRLILALAEALREEFGVGVDAHPGGEGGEAGVVNRAFMAAVREILRRVVSQAEGDAKTTSLLRQAARLRLEVLGVGADEATRLLDSGPTFGDRWLAYLALSPPSVVSDIRDGDREFRSGRGNG